jgi:excisionase family DNA binding protein
VVLSTAKSSPAALAAAQGSPISLPPDRVAFSIDEVMEIANSSRSTIYNAISDGALQAHKNGRRTVILRGALEKWIATWPAVAPKPKDEKVEAT